MHVEKYSANVKKNIEMNKSKALSQYAVHAIDLKLFTHSVWVKALSIH